MMDFLFEFAKTPLQIRNYLAEVFECSVEKIQTYDLDEFNSLVEDLVACGLNCVCVFLPVQGDAAQLLQLYRYEISDEDAIQRIIDVALKNRIHIYMPINSFDDWVYVGDAGSKNVRQMNPDAEGCFYFR